MKPKIIKLVLFLLFVFYSFGQAQVKISDNANTAIDPNSLLELESVNKGFLPPRVPIDSINGESPLTGPVPAGMLVYSSAGSVPDGYYLWDGIKWKPFNTGLGGVNVVPKSADALLTRVETFVVASGDITLTLPEITSVDNGLSITVKNIGTHVDQICVVGSNGVTIDNTDTVKLYRWKARTFVAYEGSWLRKEKDTGTDFVYEVGATGSWISIAEILEFLGEHMLAPSLVKLDGGTYEISETQVVDLGFPLTIQGPSYGQAYIVPTTAISQGSALFSCISEVSFKMIAFDATAKSGYGTHTGENALNLVTTEQYHEIKDCTFESFNKAIYITNNVEVWLFETDILNSFVAGVEIAAGTAKYVSFYTSESSFANNVKAINLVSGDSSTVSIQNCTFDCDAGQTGLNYVPATFLHSVSLFFTNNTWNNIGSFLSGFDFTRTDGRDANVDIENNAGIENKNPKCKINVLNNASTTTLNTTWTKINWTNTSTYTVNWFINNNYFRFLPINTRDIFIIISGNVSLTVARTVDIAIVKNGVSTPASARYGETTLRITSTGTAYQFSTTVYIPNVAKNDYFELWADANNNTTATFQDINIFVNAQ
jgi:hypothetical protein